ncbi:MAG: ABC transporter permease subunit [Alphaproteobacteria bacterium]|nr:ABC transporter permease subunit [Alphaproteobacteria bacterium]
MAFARTRPSLATGLAIIAIIAFAALASLVWTPYDPAAIDVARALKPPSAAHWLGADPIGRDVFSMTLVGARVSLAVALGAVLIGLAIGAPLGLLAATGGWRDGPIMRVNDVVFAFPALLLAILLTTLIGQSGLTAMIAIAIFNVPVFARVTRGAARALWRRDYILAARAAGESAAAISVRHVAPNLLDQIFAQATIQVSTAVLAEAALSYLGLGVQPPTPSWGRMLADAQTYVFLAPHLVFAPGLALIATVLGLSLVGDGLRDLFDPRNERAP